MSIMPIGQLAAQLLVWGLLLFVAGCGVLASLTDRNVNRIHGPGYRVPQLGDAADSFNRSLFIIDLHGDSSLWDRDMTVDGCPRGSLWVDCRGHIDLPRLVRGNTSLQVFTIPTITPPCSLAFGADKRSCLASPDLAPLLFALQWHPFTGPTARAVIQEERIEHWVKESNETNAQTKLPTLPRLRILTTSTELGSLVLDWKHRKKGERPAVGVLIGIEGLHGLDHPGEAASALDGRMSSLRLASLTHRFSNEYGESSEGEAMSPALTRQGEVVLQDLRRRGIVIDLAHASPCLIESVVNALGPGEPVIVSHGGYGGNEAGSCSGQRRTARNLSRSSLGRILSTDGIVGVGFWPQAACDPYVIKYLSATTQSELKPSDCESAAHRGLLVRAIIATFHLLWSDIERFCRSSEGARLTNRTGRQCSPDEHLAFGSDFDGSVVVPFDTATRSQLIIQLRDSLPGTRASRDVSMRKIAGWNACRVFATVLPGGSAQKALRECAPILEGVEDQEPAPPSGDD